MLYHNPEMGPIAPVYVSSGQLEKMYWGGKKTVRKHFDLSGEFCFKMSHISMVLWKYMYALHPLKIGFQQEGGVFISFRRIAMS